jgi:phosphoglycolate phosphatase
MINPNDVGLIMFDLHGTISDSVSPMYEAISRAYTRLGWTLPFGKEELTVYLGRTSDEFYKLITPENKKSEWKETRKVVREESVKTFREFSQTFPGVKTTLEKLHNINYKLALYSGSSGKYIGNLIDTLKIRQYFDYVKRPDDDDMNRIELAKKIIEKYGMITGIVGDQKEDIETARQTNSLSIGVLYGYGGKEMEQADITINSFDELLSIFIKKDNIHQ